MRFLLKGSFLLLFLGSLFAQTRPARSPRDIDGVPDITVPEQHRPATAQSKLRRQPVKVVTLYGMSAAAHSAHLALPNADPALIQRMRDEDAANPHQNLRVGFTRPVKVSLENGEWNDVVDRGSPKRIWLLDLESPEAYALRIHFRQFHLPAGVTMKLYTLAYAEFPLEYTGDGPRGTREFWSNPVFGSKVQLELVDARQNSLTAPAPKIEIDTIAHWYDGGFGTAAACELDYACYANWNPTGNSVARIYFMDTTGNQFVCSGTLLANESNDFTPYFLTAKHCIADTYQQMTMVAYWLDQAATCNGAVPTLASLPTTGAQMTLTTSDTSDQVLLLLNSAPPASVPFAGWTTGEPNNGVTLTSIHHPRGDPTKISFGTNAGRTLYDSVDYWLVNWTSGVTEPGSSGSPLFTSDHLVIGTDSLGSFVSCSNRGGPAYYGSFHDGFNILNSTGNYDYLIRGMMGKDKYYPNNTQATAASITLPLPLTELMAAALPGPDFFSFVVPAGKAVAIYSRNLGTSNPPLSMNVGSPADGSFTWTMNTDESGLAKPYVVWNTTGSDDTMYLQVSTYSLVSERYRLGLEIKSPDLPTVTTDPSHQYSVGPNGVSFEVMGTVEANGFPTTAHFEYSLSNNLISPLATPDTQIYVQGAQEFTYWLMNLPPNQPFAYRLVATNAAGTTHGNVVTGVTPPLSSPTVLTAYQPVIYFPPTAPGGVAIGWWPFTLMGTTVTINSLIMTGDAAFIPPATPCSLSNCWGITFSPASEGRYTGTVTLNLSNGQTFTFALLADCMSNTPIDGLQFSGPTDHVFSAPLYGFDVQKFTLSNPQMSPILIYGILSSNQDYSQINNCPPILSPGGNCDVYIQFHPVAGSPNETASITVYSQSQWFTTILSFGSAITNPASVPTRPSRTASARFAP